MSKQKILIICVIFLAAILAIFLYIRFDQARSKKFGVTFFDVGQGDSALINFVDGEKMLVDCGPDRTVLTRLGESLAFYDRTLDYLLITHPDLDHYGGCVDVLKRYRVKEIIINGEEKPSDPYWQTWKKYQEAEGAIIKVVRGAENWHIASSTLDFFSPDPALALDVGTGESNNQSIVFRLLDQGKSFMFMADAEFPLEDALLNKYCDSTTTVAICPKLQATVLKVGHHGSNSSTGEPFLEAVQPTQTIVSVGKNRFGHPSPRVLKKLQRAGAEVLRTDELGNITLP